jgi:cytoskeletal protein RodZ
VDESIGRYLGRQRRLRAISLDELSELTKIPRRSLERLEAGAFDREPDGFARGFVRTVATALGLDPDEAVMRLMREPDQEDPPVSVAASGAWRLLLLGVSAALLLSVLSLGVWRLASIVTQRAAEPAVPEVVLRRDPVRELQRERETGAPEAPAP